MIRLNEVNKYYIGDTYKVHALDTVSFSISEGEFLSIMGRSGSGKTTLLNILGFLDAPSDGEFLFLDQDVSKLNQKELWRFRRDYIGFVFQHFALINHYSVLENVALPLEATGVKRKERNRRVSEVLDMLGILELKDKYPGRISGGQRQRVAIARALVCDPKIILADEPTGALDQNTGSELLDILEEVNQMGKTIVLVTHDEKIAKRTKRIITIDAGKLISDQSVDKNGGE